MHWIARYARRCRSNGKIAQNCRHFQNSRHFSFAICYGLLALYTPCLKKTVPVLFCEELRETLAEFNNFWQATWQRKWHKRSQFCPPNINTVATLPCEMQKLYFGRLQQWIHSGYRMPAQKIIVRPENHWKSVTSLTLIRSKSIVVYLGRRQTEKTH